MVLVHYVFGRAASLEFSPAFQSREESVKRLRRVATLERFGSSVATRQEVEMPLNPAFKRWAKFKGRYASKTKMKQYPLPRCHPDFHRKYLLKKSSVRVQASLAAPSS